MGVDYQISIRRKKDDKEIGVVIANLLKPILDSSLSGKINCENHRNSDKVKFEVSHLEDVITSAKERIASEFGKKKEQQLYLTVAKSESAINHIEEKISFCDEQIEEYFIVLEAASEVLGMIQCLVEDQIKGEKAAYEYNGDGNGDYVWNHDVYCIIDASW